MSSAPAPPPCLAPPPPPCPSVGVKPLKQQLADNLREQQLKRSKKTPAELCEDLRLRINQHDAVIFSSHKEIEHLVQEGPKCGLVALCMASQYFMPEPLSIDSVFNSAIDLGYTLQGEMFSAVNMRSLAGQLLHCQSAVMEFSMDNCMEFLLTRKNALILVPYDRDFNNEPCNKRGHSAHWAVISGVIIISNTTDKDKVSHNADEDMLSNESDKDTYSNSTDKDKVSNTADKDMLLNITNMDIISKLQQDSNHPWLYHILNKLDKINITNFMNKDIYVYANQGKSIVSHTWSLQALVESNVQLNEPGTDIQENMSEFCIPVGGVTEGLNGKAVVLWSE